MTSEKIGQMAQCMAHGCPKPAVNKLGLRLRKPGIRRAVWAPDVEAYLCKEHAEDGGDFVIEYRPSTSPKTVDITVQSGAAVVTNRKTPVRKPAA
jgi:hypothetical protein